MNTLGPAPKGRVCIRVMLAVTALLSLAASGSAQGNPEVTILSPSKQSPVQTNLVSDIPGLAISTDPNLVNPWGVANSATSPYWVSDQGTGKSTLYNGAGVQTALIVSIPSVGVPSGPTGQVVVPAGVTGFHVPGSTTTARFIFATLDGTIAAWASGTTAATAATVSGAVFTGLALANNGTANYLYAANFVSGGTVRVFDSSFQPATLAGSFTDPGSPADFAPFNIQLLGGKLYVVYAQVAGPGEPIPGAGLGFVDVFDTNGNFLQTLVSHSSLNAPWGITMSPAGFVIFPNDLLIGNFGNGEINAYNPTTGAYVGTISGSGGRPLVNEGLWTIQFGNGNAGSNPNALYFTAGINDERDGLFGAITPSPVTLTFASQLVGTTSAPQTLTVENTGSGPLSLSDGPSLNPSTTEFTIVAGTGTTCTNGATVPPGGTCTIAVTFKPLAAGNVGPVALTLTDNSGGVAGATQTVNLSGIAVGGAIVGVSPGTLTFSTQPVRTASAAQTVTLTNSGNVALTISSIGTSTDFSQTNTCGASVAAGANCTISVSFTPTRGGNLTGTLTISDNNSGPGGATQSVALSGTSQDFVMASSGLPAQSVAPGGTATWNFALSSYGGLNQTVTLSCSGAPANSTCTVTPGTASSSGGTFAVSVKTSAPAGAVPRRGPLPLAPPPLPEPQTLLMLAALLAGMAWSIRSRRRAGALRLKMALVALAAGLLLMLAMAGCGANNIPVAPPSTTTPTTPAKTGGTPGGQYNVVVTGTTGSGASAITETSTVILVVG